MLLSVPDIAPQSGTRLPDRIAGVLFDMDGTLLDSEATHLRAFRDAGHAIGWPIPDALLLDMVGIHRDANAAMLRDRLGSDFPLADFYARGDALFEAAAEAGIPVRPGARALLAHLARSGIPLAIVTSTDAPFAQQRLARAGLLDFFATIVTRSDVTRPKPDPQPYAIAAQRLGVAPAACIAVEDSHTGVRSALAAGIATVMVPDLLPPTPALARACAHVLGSLADLHALLDPSS